MDKREYLNSLGIHELRIMGRSVGVKSPASRKKEDLIDCILNIENGLMPKYRSKKGRKPKGFNNVGDTTENDVFGKKLLVPLSFDENEENSFSDGSATLEATNDIVGLSMEKDFMGIVREAVGKKRIIDYSGEMPVITLPDDFENDFVSGDLVRGVAEINNNYVVGLNDVARVQFKLKGEKERENPKVVVVNSIQDMYRYILEDRGERFVVEVEAVRKIKQILSQKNIYCFNTFECDDLSKSYNLILDFKNLVKNLVTKDVEFTIYLVDVEYIYGMLCAYLSSKNEDFDVKVNVGQIFKEILSMVGSSEKGSIVVFEKENDKSEHYLNVILRRYCDNKF